MSGLTKADNERFKAEQTEMLRRALNGRSRYKLALQSALAVMGFDAVQIDELVTLAYDCQFEELNRRMVIQTTVLIPIPPQTIDVSLDFSAPQL
jgi:hypothetical protein